MEQTAHQDTFPGPGLALWAGLQGGAEACRSRDPSAAPGVMRLLPASPSLLQGGGLLPTTANASLLPGSLLCRQCLLLWREEGRWVGPDCWSEHCPPIGDHQSGGSSAGPADPRAHLGNGPHRSLVAHHPTPKPASSLLPAPLLYLRYPLHLAGFTAPRPPGLPAQQQGWCFTDKHLIPSLLYRKSWRRPPRPRIKCQLPAHLLQSGSHLLRLVPQNTAPPASTFTP